MHYNWDADVFCNYREIDWLIKVTLIKILYPFIFIYAQYTIFWHMCGTAHK